MREIQPRVHRTRSLTGTLLDVSLRSATETPSGTIRMRSASSAGIGHPSPQPLRKMERVTDRLTHADDLAEQVTDTERELTLLTTHRDRLSEFLKDRSLKIDQLITVSRELASVQTQLEAAATTRANLRRRIDTELLTLNLSVPANVVSAQRTPVRDALRHPERISPTRSHKSFALLPRSFPGWWLSCRAITPTACSGARSVAGSYTASAPPRSREGERGLYTPARASVLA